LNIILFGAPACGKGTQAKFLMSKGLRHLSTGELLREEVLSRTPLGLEVENILADGRLAADHIVTALVANRLDKRGNFLFDGYPRTVWQAISLDGMLKEFDQKIDLLINLSVDTTKLMDRVAKRYKEECRADDNPASFAVRLKSFEDMKNVLEHYTKRGVVHTIDGMQEPAVIASQIEALVGEKQV
jgi:adenylate kinase